MDSNIFDLSGRVALITGGGSGLGRAFCESMAKYGADVVCVDMQEQGAKETVELVRRFKHRAIAVKTDVSKPDDVDRMVSTAIKEFGRIDILFNNAGVTSTPRKIGETPIEVWDKIIAVDLRGVFLCMRAVLPIMVKQKDGRIINIASIGAFGGSEPEVAPAAYGVAKAGVISLTKYAAIEYSRDGIRVNCIAPGVHRTPFGAGTNKTPGEIESEVIKFIPLGRIGEPRDMEGLAVFLSSDASSYITGQVFVQDGGMTAKV